MIYNPCKHPYKFRYLHPLFWERVLPAVYDDTLTYYELLAKLICKINEFVELANQYGTIVDNFEEIDQLISDLNDRIDALNELLPDIDDIPTDGSENLVTSNGVYDFVMALTNLLRQIDVYPTDGSMNLVTSDGVHDAIQDAISNVIGGYPDLGIAISNYLHFNAPVILQYGTPYNVSNGFTLGGKYLTGQWNDDKSVICIGGFVEFRLTSELTSGAMSARVPLINIEAPNYAGTDILYNSVGITLNWSSNVKRSCGLRHKANGTFELQIDIPIYWAPTGQDIQGNWYYDCCTFFAFPIFLAANQGSAQTS